MDEKQEATAVWAINHLRHVDGNPLWWPAIRCQPEDVPGVVPPPISNRVLVRYTGPATSKEKDFDCYWVVPDEVMDFEEYREQFQAQPTANHETDMAVAIQEAADHMQSLTGLETERAGLEVDLLYIVDNIPNSNQSGFRVYADERAATLQESGCPVGDPEFLEEALRKEYQALPEAERRGHERRGRDEYVAVMQKARNILVQRGKRYLDLCERLGVAAHQTLVPIIRLLLVPPEEEAHWPIKGGHSKQFKSQSFKRERQDSPIRGHNSNSGASSQMHAFQGTDQNGLPRKIPKSSHSLDDGEPGLGPPPVELQRPPEDLAVRVMCNGYEGVLYPAFSKVVHKDREFTAPQFEQFCGAGSTKKWKISLRVVPGSVPECPIGERPMLVGKWLEKKGFASGNLRTKSGQKFARPPFGS